MHRRILALIGDRYHPVEDLREGLLPLALERGQTDFVSRTEDCPWYQLSNYSLIVLAKGGYDFGPADSLDWMGEKSARLRDYVVAGGGLLILHSGLAGYERNPCLLDLAHASFLSHPPGCIPVRLEPTANTLLPARAPIEIVDEQYFLRFTRHDHALLLENSSESHGRAHAGWAHHVGEGRVLCLSPGHTTAVFANPGIQALLRDAVDWLRAGQHKPGMPLP